MQRLKFEFCAISSTLVDVDTGKRCIRVTTGIVYRLEAHSDGVSNSTTAGTVHTNSTILCLIAHRIPSIESTVQC
jgi:hypothetical protein